MSFNKTILTLTLSTLLILFISVDSTYAQGKESKPTYRVSLDVSADDQIKRDIISYVSRELRTLSDIIIVEKESRFRINIVALRLKNKESETGYALSITVTEKLDKHTVETYSNYCSIDGFKDFLRVFLNREEMLEHFILVGSDLKELCSNLVTGVDAGPFEVQRKVDQHIKDTIKRD